ncbi:MAG: cation transporter [Caldilineaceae bacterium]|nr:cation transporter [Caldilineaceae bacterium]
MTVSQHDTTFTTLRRYAWLSVAAAVLTIGLKTGAYLLTGSIGLFSDALESVVNLAAALMALTMLTVAARPPDEEHLYGHTKAEYFSSGVEGALIIMAAASIGYAALGRLLHPAPLEQVSWGLIVATAASLVNLFASRLLRKAGENYGSITLVADAKHLMTDVWTSVGVVLGVAAASLTGWLWLDSVIALLVAIHILWIGVQLLRESALGLMDTALPAEERAQIVEILERYRRHQVTYHSLRTRRAGLRRFMSVHVLTPGIWTVQEGHNWLERIEAEIRTALPNITILTHLEPVEDPRSMDDKGLDRVMSTPVEAKEKLYDLRI